ncbi:glycosyltransferase family 2 protein [Streptomyces sp. NPDC001380]|uniref:glycosyltransferase family 2 protein n=1 Tax=Streptomyces sp. NPDC001380 TaxID=3364566 RepID=UPI0036CD4E63
MHAPLISIVVPAHDESGRLGDCLDSVLRQSFADVEVLVVQDRSPQTPQTLPASSRDPRVAVLRLGAAVGVGQARSAGADRARGGHLLFLDADHTLADGALQALADRLREAGDPDVLLFGHAHLHAGRRPGAAAELLEAAASGTFAPLERPELFGAPAHSWDRLVRRELWVREGLRFPEGLYEEVPVVVRAMLAARSAAVLPRECVELHRRHTLHPAGSPGSSHFDIFGQYERAFAHVEALGPAAEPVRVHLFDRMVRHCLFVLELGGCVPRASRQAFFRAAADHHRRYLPAGHRRPEGREGVKFSLLAGGSYSAYEIAKLSHIAGGRVASRLR